MNGEKLKMYRIQLELSQEKFAKKVGVSRGYLNMIENNKATPSIGLLTRIAEELGKEVGDFF